VLEEALIAFPGVVLMVSHDRYFLNRVCTGILAFEGDERISYCVGDYDYYLEMRARRAAVLPGSRPVLADAGVARSSSSRPRKLTWKETREWEGMEAQIRDADSEIARIETLFATPDFHRIHGAQTSQLVAELAAAKEVLTGLYARWEELEALKAAGERG
jgi:ATP-binding cassette subfamily F protein uup